MLNFFYTQHNFFFKLMLDKNNVFLKFSSKNLYLYTTKISIMDISLQTLIDFSTFNSSSLRKNNLFYIFLNKKSFNQSTVYFFNQTTFYSHAKQKTIFEWYEREVFEKKVLKCFNLNDKRNLLLNYNIYYDNELSYYNTYF